MGIYGGFVKDSRNVLYSGNTNSALTCPCVTKHCYKNKRFVSGKSRIRFPEKVTYPLPKQDVQIKHVWTKKIDKHLPWKTQQFVLGVLKSYQDKLVFSSAPNDVCSYRMCLVTVGINFRSVLRLFQEFSE